MGWPDGDTSFGLHEDQQGISGHQQVVPALYGKKNVPHELPSHFAKDLPRETHKAQS